MNLLLPTEADAQSILHEALGLETISIRRFPTGLANWVYDVTTKSGESLVVRLARPDLKGNFEGALYWYPQLLKKGVPLPRLHYAELDETKHGFPVMIIDRLPGTDLGEVYGDLSEEQKKEIAREAATIQKRVGELSDGKGYGYGKNPNDPALLKSWGSMIEASLSRSRQRMEKMGIFPPKIIERVRYLVDSHRSYIEAIEPVCYLDDITTKNVIIHNGSLAGIVDVDGVAFGDPLFTVALTNMALISAGQDTHYIDCWLENMDATSEQREIMRLYTALYCLDFMSEMGMVFNKEKPEPVNEERVKKLLSTLDSLVESR